MSKYWGRWQFFPRVKCPLPSELDKPSLVPAKKTDHTLNVWHFLLIQEICKIKGPNSVCGYCTGDLHLCFIRLSHEAAYTASA